MLRLFTVLRLTRNTYIYFEMACNKNLAMIEEIRRQLHLTTLKFQRLADLVNAIGLPKEKLCTHCWDGSSWGL